MIHIVRSAPMSILPLPTMTHTSPPSRRQRSIEVPGVTHGGAPIPMGARVGNMIYSSRIMGKDPSTDTLPDAPQEQARLAFRNLRVMLERGGSRLEDVVHMTAYVRGDEMRPLLNAQWAQAFPDPDDRPARYTQVAHDLPDGVHIQLGIVAVVQEP